MAIHKVIYFSSLPLLEVTVKKYYMEELISRGIQVEYLDVSSLFNKTGFSECSDRLGIVHKAYSYHELKQYLKSQDRDSTLFLSQITYNSSYLRFFHLLKKMRCLTGSLAVGLLPLTQKTVKQQIKILSFKRLWQYFKNRLTSFWVLCGYINCYHIIFRVGKVLENKTYSRVLLDPFRASKLININSTDYDLYLRVKHLPRLLSTPYVLFLDEYLPFHPDLDYLGWKKINAERYYRDLNIFFKRIEEAYQTEVVIAAHPKAEKYKTTNYFEGRKVIKGNTALLARDADFLLVHESTTIGLATIFNKKMFFLTSEEIKEVLPDVNMSIYTFAEVFNSQLIYFDSNTVPDLTMNIDTEKYESYKYTYLTSKGTENKQTVDILTDFLKNGNR